MRKFWAGVLSATLIAFGFPLKLESANLTSTADTLSTSRLSYLDALSALHTQGTTLVSAASTANLFTGDTVLIGDTTTASTYTVDDIYSATQFTTTAGLDATDIQANDVVVATRSATHTITFTTASAIANGAIRVLVASGTNGNADGIPNHDGFDYGTAAGVGATAPSGGGVTSWEAATATASGGTGCSAGYHCFEARYNGTNNVNASLTFSINRLINPSPASGHSAGTADTYTVTIQHLGPMTSQYPVVDSTSVKIALIESVRVTATVDPTITFTVAGVNSSTSTCGITTDVTSTATTVPFGTLALNTFKEAAHTLTVSTNAASGYSVTAVENDQLGKDGGTTPNIVDTPCDSGPCTQSAEQEWSTATNNGFGYSLDNDDAAAIAFQHDTGGGTFKSRQFADAANSEAAVELFSSTTVANSQNINICYRISVGATQAAGDYENNITYTATATF
jgi:hypothetical protein